MDLAAGWWDKSLLQMSDKGCLALQDTADAVDAAVSERTAVQAAVGE